MDNRKEKRNEVHKAQRIANAPFASNVHECLIKEKIASRSAQKIKDIN